LKSLPVQNSSFWETVNSGNNILHRKRFGKVPFCEISLNPSLPQKGNITNTGRTEKTFSSLILSLRLVRSASGGSAEEDKPLEKERFPTRGNDKSCVRTYGRLSKSLFGKKGWRGIFLSSIVIPLCEPKAHAGFK